MNLQNYKKYLLLLSLIAILNTTLKVIDFFNVYDFNLLGLYSSILLSIIILVIYFKSRKGILKFNSSDYVKKEISIIVNGHINKGLNSVKNKLGPELIRQKKIKSSIKNIEEGIQKLRSIHKNL